MIKIENEVTPSREQWQAAVRGCRNPFDSWKNSDSTYGFDFENNYIFKAGEKDLTLMTRLANAGDDHGKFLRMLPVVVDITAPFYWWKQMDTYKIGTVADSCSTMHRLMAEPFTEEDFSFEYTPDHTANSYLAMMNHFRSSYLKAEDSETKNTYWRIVNELLLNCYNQKRTWSANYQVLRHIYHARKNHKLQEWHDFCYWIETLPYAKELIIGEAE